MAWKLGRFGIFIGVMNTDSEQHRLKTLSMYPGIHDLNLCVENILVKSPPPFLDLSGVCIV